MLKISGYEQLLSTDCPIGLRRVRELVSVRLLAATFEPCARQRFSVSKKTPLKQKSNGLCCPQFGPRRRGAPAVRRRGAQQAGQQREQTTRPHRRGGVRAAHFYAAKP